MIKHLSKNDDFKSIISNGTWLVDFYADWCGPCKMLGSVLETLEDTNILKVNVDEFQSLSMNYKVMSIPNIIIFKDGNMVKSSIGFSSKEEIIKLLN